MSTDPLGRMPVNQLRDRYKLTRSVIYKRLKDLGIEREKIGNRAYLNREQLSLLDALHEFIQGGGTTAEFLFYRGFDPDNPL
jgi:hypothetical protein